MATFRRIKPQLLALIQSDSWVDHIPEILAMNHQQVVGPLFSFLLHNDLTRWRSISVLGRLYAHVADTQWEDARVFMRRLIWNLNEESGNIAWGAPETMGEACALHPRLAKEYHSILISYAQDHKAASNYLDHPPLRFGAFWGIARLAQTRPEMAASAIPALVAGLQDEFAPSQGICAWALGTLQHTPAAPLLTAQTANPASVAFFRNYTLEETTVGTLAREALDRLDG